MLSPDVPVRASAGGTRPLRSLARDGLLLLLTDVGDVDERDVTGCGPVRVVRLSAFADICGESPISGRLPLTGMSGPTAAKRIFVPNTENHAIRLFLPVSGST
ncbi:hypothetical protein GCM10010464_18780 [Pseudonocardia yunnanensis]|uniref:Uncharacterized protein n=1 Tax=Pseudonocardia yunnanensis TaxID=58107 RepID=A0ABW4EVQ1_9PSEU